MPSPKNVDKEIAPPFDWKGWVCNNKGNNSLIKAIDTIYHKSTQRTGSAMNTTHKNLQLQYIVKIK